VIQSRIDTFIPWYKIETRSIDDSTHEIQHKHPIQYVALHYTYIMHSRHLQTDVKHVPLSSSSSSSSSIAPKTTPHVSSISSSGVLSSSTSTSTSSYMRRAKSSVSSSAPTTHTPSPLLLTLLIPPFLLCLSFGGTSVLSTLTIGLLLSFAAFQSAYESLSFSLYTFSFTFSIFSLWHHGLSVMHYSVFSLFLLLNLTMILILAGIYCSLYLYPVFFLSYPGIRHTLHVLLHTCSSMPVACIMCWAFSAWFGTSWSPFTFLFLLYACIRVTSESGSMSYFPMRLLRLHWIALYFIPMAFHASIHHRVLIAPLSLSSMALLFSASLALTPSMILPSLISSEKKAQHEADSQPGGAAGAGSAQSHIPSMVPLTFISLVLLSASLAYRLVFPAFTAYISHFVWFPLLSPILVTSALFAFFAMLLVPTARIRATFYVFFLATLLSIASLPLLLALLFSLPCAELSYRLLEKPSLGSHLSLSLLLTGFSVWFVHHHYAHLDVTLSYFSLPLLTLASICVAFLAFSLVMPGLGQFLPSTVFPIALCVYFPFLFFMEFTLSSSDSYPYYLVLFTSAGTYYVAHHLSSTSRISPALHWFLSALAVAKLSLFSSASPTFSLHFLYVLLSFSPVFFFGRFNLSRCLFHMALTSFSLYLCRNTLLHTFFTFLLQQPIPLDSMMPLLFITIVASWTPFTFVHLSSTMPKLRRMNSIALALTLTYAVTSFSASSTSTTSPSTWLMMFGLTVCLLSITSIVTLPRLVLAVLTGVCFSVYTINEYLPPSSSLWLDSIYVCMFVTTSAFIVYLSSSRDDVSSTAAHSPSWWSYLLFLALLPVGHVMQAFTYTSMSDHDLLEMSRIALYTLHAMLNFLVALAVKATLAKQSGTGSGTGSGSGTGVDQSIALAPLGNLACVLAFVQGLIVHTVYLHGSVHGIFFLAPILLLLSRDNVLLSQLTEQRRYFPLILSIVSFLLLKSYFAIVWLAFTSSTMAAAKNFVLAVATTPSHMHLLEHIWSMRHQSDFTLLLLLPLNILPIVLADIPALHLVGLIGFAGVTFLLYSARQIKQHGMQII
jgi:hypothetical protein